MKKLFFFFLMGSFAFGQKFDRSVLIIPPKQLVQINYPNYKGLNIKIWNESRLVINVFTRNKLSDSLQKSFELKKKRDTLVETKNGIYLQFENRNLSPIKVAYALREKSLRKNKFSKPLTFQRAFYLENNTAQSLQLYIPGVMNPKLNPFSRSGVDLTNGQKIYFDLKGRKVLILTVNESIHHGSRIDVANLIEKALNKE
jgi:antitoxin component of MazEF toxin-antitoxin module